MSLSTSANLSLSQINNVARFTNGNLGIGTTAPAYTLDVVGNVNATSLLKSGSALTSTSTFNSMVTYNTTATLTTTSPTDVEVSGQIGDVTIVLPANNTSGNIITVHNVGGTTGSVSSGVFVRIGTSTTSGSIARIRPGESVTTMSLQTAGTTPKAYQKTISRKGGNGSQWTERSIPNARNWVSVCWSPELGLFCAVNSGSAAVVMTSPDGITWTERSIPNNRNWYGVCWAPELGLFCAVNYNSAAFVMTSADGVSWTERSIPTARNWISVCWAAELGLFCAVNQASAAFVMTSPNGITWTERSIPNSRNWYSVTWAPELGLFCAVNNNSAAFVMTSADGVSWTERSIPASRNYRSICWSPQLGLFCAVTVLSAAVVMTSPDGITWTERSIPNSRNWMSICWSSELGLFCAFGDLVGFVMTSSDGITWTERAIPNARSWQSVCWSPELMTLCAVNYGSAASVLTSFGIPVNLQVVRATSLGTTSTLTTNTVTYTLSNYFTDNVGTTLFTYSLTANPNSSASISNGILSVTGNYRAGTYTVTVQATNLSGKTATSSLSVVEATPPAPTSTSLGSVSLTNNTVQYTLSNYFTGFNMTYDFTVNSYGAYISSGILYVTGAYRNTSYTVTVRATNAGGSATSSLSVNETFKASQTLTNYTNITLNMSRGIVNSSGYWVGINSTGTTDTVLVSTSFPPISWTNYQQTSYVGIRNIVTDGTFYIQAGGGYLYNKSDPRTTTFTSSAVGTPPNNSFGLFFFNNRLFSWNSRKELSRSTNGGATWTIIQTFTYSLYSMAASPDGVLCMIVRDDAASTWMAIYSTDYGTTWYSSSGLVTAAGIDQSTEGCPQLVTWVKDRFVAVAAQYIFYSSTSYPYAGTWTYANDVGVGTTATPFCIVFSPEFNSIFITYRAVTQSNARVFTSTNYGVSISTLSSGVNYRMMAIYRGGSPFVVLTSNTTSYAIVT